MNPGTCIHFTGMGGDKACCKANVNYHVAFAGEKPGLMLRAACIQYRTLPAHGRGTYIKAGVETVTKAYDRRGETMVPCEHFREPTADEIRVDREESDAFVQRTLTAMKISAAWRVKGKPDADRHEVIECPICKGSLHLRQSSYNGHVHGQCETEGCARWME